MIVYFIVSGVLTAAIAWWASGSCIEWLDNLFSTSTSYFFWTALLASILYALHYKLPKKYRNIYFILLTTIFLVVALYEVVYLLFVSPTIGVSLPCNYDLVY